MELINYEEWRMNLSSCVSEIVSSKCDLKHSQPKPSAEHRTQIKNRASFRRQFTQPSTNSSIILLMHSRLAMIFACELVVYRA
ncbi:hypothetical protein D3C87_1921390 [compost metagenome]